MQRFNEREMTITFCCGADDEPLLQSGLEDLRCPRCHARWRRFEFLGYFRPSGKSGTLPPREGPDQVPETPP